jgi:hypothetical protein
MAKIHLPRVRMTLQAMSPNDLERTQENGQTGLPCCWTTPYQHIQYLLKTRARSSERIKRTDSGGRMMNGKRVSQAIEWSCLSVSSCDGRCFSTLVRNTNSWYLIIFLPLLGLLAGGSYFFETLHMGIIYQVQGELVFDSRNTLSY